MQYFLDPSPLLANHVWFYSIFEPRGEEVERVTPGGSISIEIQLDPDKAKKENILILSRFTKPRFVRPSDLGKYFVIAFYPWAVRPFLNVPLSKVTDKKVPLEDIFGPEIKLLHEQIMNVGDEKEIIPIVENYLIKTLYDPAKNDTLVAEAVRHILKSRGLVTVQELARVYNLSVRRLQQRFNETIGVTPKVYSRVTKFQHTLSLMRDGRAKNLTEITYLSGYFDQAHFIHDFQSFSGTSPQKYRSENLVIDTLNAIEPVF